MVARRFVLALLFVAACGGGTADKGAPPNPDPLGPGQRISDVGDPRIMGHPQTCPGAPATNDEAGCSQANVTGASVVWVDTFDETKNGKSRGTIYVQDVGSTAPYAGM